MLSLLGLSGPLKWVIIGGLALSAAGAAVAWLRWDAISDERVRAAAAGNAAVIQVIKDRNVIEEEINASTDDNLRDLLGIPGGLRRAGDCPC